MYSDGNSKKISWVIQTKDSIVKQTRRHTEMYLDKVNSLQSKYIAFHVGLFWGIGTFIIKNEDELIVKLDDKIMFEHLTLDRKNVNEFIKKRSQFINQLILQRKLKIQYDLISKEENLAGNLI